MQGGAGPPFRNPPSLRDLGSAFGASLRACMLGLAISGRRTQTPGRSPCFRQHLVGPSPLAGEVGWGTESLGERRQRRLDPAALRLQPGGQPELLAQVL